ncbi:MAG: Bax inhibitor-1 family protein [Pseudomonadota bacterium]
MSTPKTAYGYSPSTGWETEQRRVLQKTYGLLALTLLPTVAGAYLGMSNLELFMPLFKAGSLIAGLVLFAISWFLISLVDRNSDSKAGIGFLALFTGFSGFIIAPLLASVLHTPNGAHMVGMAAGSTAAIFATMALLANFVKADAQKWIGFILVGFWVVLAVKIIGAFFPENSALMQAGCAMAIILFSAWIFFDIKNVLTGAQGNYIRATLSLYLNIFNVFINILQLITSFGGGSRR